MAKHIPVLLNECIESLNIQPDGIYVDGTVGLGGHSSEIVRHLTTGRLICIDRDETAIERSRERLKEWKDKICLSFKQDSGVRFNQLLKNSRNIITSPEQSYTILPIL